MLYLFKLFIVGEENKKTKCKNLFSMRPEDDEKKLSKKLNKIQ